MVLFEATKSTMRLSVSQFLNRILHDSQKINFDIMCTWVVNNAPYFQNTKMYLAYNSKNLPLRLQLEHQVKNDFSGD
jgi:hypothetical protein